jgi:hypothetical protein
VSHPLTLIKSKLAMGIYFYLVTQVPRLGTRNNPCFKYF